LPYKASKIEKYWPEDLPGARRLRLIETWSQIVPMLDLFTALDEIARLTDRARKRLRRSTRDEPQTPDGKSGGRRPSRFG